MVKQKEQPSFSIITVTYNASQWLERTIQSVQEQSYPHIQHLIIDGGSTDGTLNIIKRYESSLSYWVSERDGGLYDAMNKGSQAAKDDYIWFINAGDLIYSPDTVQKIVDSIGDGTLPDIIYGETEIVGAHGENLGLRRLRAPKTLTWKSFRMGMLVCHQSFIVKRSIAPEYDLSYRFSADYDWCIRCLKKAAHIHNTRLILSRFLEAGMSTTHRKGSLKERYEIMCRYYGQLTTQILHIWFAIRFYSAKWFTGKV